MIFGLAKQKKEHIACHKPGTFSGDIDLLSGRPVVVSATSQGETTLIELSRATLRALVVQESGISDILVAAFLARRAILLDQSDSAELVIVGPETNADTHNIRKFLLKNQLPHRWLSPEDDQALNGFCLTPFRPATNIPLSLMAKGKYIPQMTVTDIADLTGLRRTVTDQVYDVAVVGADPVA